MPAQVTPQKLIQGVDLVDKNTTTQLLSLRRLEEKVAIITGGARGIGEANRVFVKHGAKAVIADIADAAGIALANSLAPSAVYVHCDVSSEEDVEMLINRTISLYGKLDILVNNAGVLGNQSKKKSIIDFDAGEFDRVMQVNVRGVALGMKHAAKVMMPRRSGCIISMASVAGCMGGLTKNTACELGQYGIRMNCISPFGVATSMLINAWRSSDEVDHEECTDLEAEEMEEFVRGLANLKGVTLKTKDVAEAALYMASEESRYISGHNLVVDGGFTSFKNCVAL
ncbi:hypothetical protein ERO13_A05G109200v2 [Gossypium hirsutum]|uniref:Short-chain dehydrogenase reductase 2a n=1 Tax=Gossypium hirsutum TaxID=3635 RepID=A0A1U8PHQ1_GOSHI|nr:short-chain dehydrogenase reductase 2a-like [Gossypium hirsutum]KAG4198811.1 hypothetical protein ERO13_A05G109200v2 [Gossypium hirsutum]